MTTTTIHTPWGWSQDTLELSEGVWRVTTAGHGGLKLSRERWEELPDVVRDSFLNPRFAEEDCEEPIARTLLGLGDERERELAIRIAGYFDRYAPALPFLRETSPGPHYHVIAYWGGYGSGPFGRFDTGEEAEAFAAETGNVRDYGRMEAIECGNARCGRGGR